MMPFKNYHKRNTLLPGKKQWTWMFLSIFLLGVTGCCGETVLEREYGNAWAYNQAVQFANPQAELTETPAVGLTPKSSANVMDAYNKTFTGKSGSTNQTTINLSGPSTGGSSGGSSGGN
jgi:hypothetical protein